MASASPPTSHIGKLRAFVKTHVSKFVDWWFAVQVAHYGGKYSIERMLALEEYTRVVSLTRVISISVGTPLVVVVTVLLQESIPLQDPAAGWRANYGFWCRAAMTGLAVGIASTVHMRLWINFPTISTMYTLLYCIATAAGYVSAGIGVAAIWVFPVPFYMFTLCWVATIIILAYIRIVVGARAFWDLFARREHIRQMNRIGALQALLYVAYPLYQVVFSKANHTDYELPVMLLLPAFRLVVKRVFSMVALHKDDVLPVLVVFTVDFFDSLYLATFMQTLSATTLVVIVVIDIVQTAVELQELHQRTRRIIARTRRVAGGSSFNSLNNGTLLEAVRSLCSTSGVLQKQIRVGINVRSCIEHQLSAESDNLLRTIENSRQSGAITMLFEHQPSTVRLQSQPASIVPTPIEAVSKKGRSTHGNTRISVQPVKTGAFTGETASKYSSRRRSVVDSSVVLKEALEVFFTSECLVLAEYVEVIIPVLYGAFILTMVHQSSAQYHTEMNGVTLENVNDMVLRMFLYALLELASFIVLALITKRNCGVNALYQLAFVLETHLMFIQSALLIGVLMTLTFRVVHFGIDFSFQFEWITPRA